MINLRMIGIGVASVVLLSGCATRGQLNRGLEEQRQALATERSERQSADQAMQSDIAAVRGDVQALRTELQSMRTEFGAQITALQEGLRFAFPVNFAFDDANIRSEDMAALDRFMQVATTYYPNSLITVEGFTDPAGSVAYNRNLSERRANSVRDYLVSRGMSAEQLRAVGYGKTRLVNPGAWGDQPGAEANRRVVFVVETSSTAAAAVANN
jgi:peptidoglycan-associated lipoprotein